MESGRKQVGYFSFGVFFFLVILVTIWKKISWSVASSGCHIETDFLNFQPIVLPVKEPISGLGFSLCKIEHPRTTVSASLVVVMKYLNNLDVTFCL